MTRTTRPAKIAHEKPRVSVADEELDRVIASPSRRPAWVLRAVAVELAYLRAQPDRDAE